MGYGVQWGIWGGSVQGYGALLGSVGLYGVSGWIYGVSGWIWGRFMGSEEVLEGIWGCGGGPW